MTQAELIHMLTDYFDNVGMDDALAQSIMNKHYDKVLSDARCKALAAMSKLDKLSDTDIAFLMQNAGDFNGKRIADMQDDDWDEDMLQGYAQHLRNYLYTYKDSAKRADPRIDTSELHNGPMAQDIEQVAPDCVQETSDGIKTVDGNRLALVNAGVLGDVIRKLNAIDERLTAGGL